MEPVAAKLPAKEMSRRVNYVGEIRHRQLQERVRQPSSLLSTEARLRHPFLISPRPHSLVMPCHPLAALLSQKTELDH